MYGVMYEQERIRVHGIKRCRYKHVAWIGLREASLEYAALCMLVSMVETKDEELYILTSVYVYMFGVCVQCMPAQ